MSVLEDIRQAVANSTTLEAGVKSVVTDFLQAAGPAIETLAPEVVRGLMSKLAAGDSSATGGVAQTLSAEQVDATLGTLEQQMQREVDQRATQVAAERQMIAALQSAAVSVLAKLLISAI